MKNLKPKRNHNPKKGLQMAERLDQNEMVSIRELLIANSIQVDARN